MKISTSHTIEFPKSNRTTLRLLLWTLLLVLGGRAMQAQNYEIDVRISSSADDAEERFGDGAVDLTSSDIELTQDGTDNQYVGLRFGQINIPQGARIVSAYLELTNEEFYSGATSVTIKAQKSASAQAFTDQAFDLTGRPRTDAAVAWNNLAAYPVNQTVKTPNLRTLVQEVVDQSGWTANNHLAFFIEGAGRRNFHSYDGNAAQAPRLVITYDDTELTANKVRSFYWNGWNNQPFGHSPDPYGCSGSWETTWTLFKGTAPFVVTEYDNGTLIAEGEVEQLTDATKRFDFYMVLHNKRNWADWSALGRMFYEGAGATCSPNHVDWHYFELDDTRSRWTGSNGYAHEGKVSKMTHRPADLSKGVQMGFGAHNGAHNNCEKEFLRGWVGFEGDYQFVCGDFSAPLNGFEEATPCNVQNSGFEDGLAHWIDQSDSPTITTDAFAGSQAAALTANDASLRQTALPAEPGVIYEFTAMSKVVTPSTGDYLRIKFYDADWNVLQESQTTVAGDKWHLEKVAAKAPAGTVMLAIHAGKGQGGELRFDELCVQVVEDYVYSECTDRLKNPSFENDLAHWGVPANASSVTDAVVDAKALYMDETATESAFTYQLFNSAPGETISFDFWAKREIMSAAGHPEPRIKIVYYRGYNDIIDYTYTSVNSTEWKEYNVTGTTPFGTASVMVVFNNFPGQRLWADGGCIKTVFPVEQEVGECGNVQNPGFESDKAHWSTDDAATNVIVTDAAEGNKAMRVTNGNLWQGDITVVAGNWYQVEVDAKVTDPSKFSEINVQFADDNWTSVGSEILRVMDTDYTTQTLLVQAPQNATRISLGAYTESVLFVDAFCFRTATAPPAAGFDPCVGCHDNIWVNGGFEQDNGANNFPYTLEGAAFDILEQGNQSVHRWHSSVLNADRNYYFNDVNDVVNNPEGDRFLYMPSGPNCLTNNTQMEGHADLEEGVEYELCFYAAAYTIGLDSTQMPTGAVVAQHSTNLLLEFGHDGGGATAQAAYFLPKSHSLAQLHWQKLTYRFTYSSGLNLKRFIFSAAGEKAGIALDGVALFKTGNCPQVPETCEQEGLLMEFYNVAGTSIDDIYGHFDYPAKPDAALYSVHGAGFNNSRGDHYFTRARGYLQAPYTGTYYFNGLADDKLRVFLSDGIGQGEAEQILEVTAYTADNHNFEPSQTSAGIQLQAGNYYYIELLHREVGGGDWYNLYWKTPGTPNHWTAVPNSVLTPYECPEISCNEITPPIYVDRDYACTVGAAFTFHTTAIPNTTLEWYFGANATPASATGVGPHTVTYSAAGAQRAYLSAVQENCTSQVASNYIYIAQPEFCTDEVDVSCEDGRDVEVIARGITNAVPATVNINNPASVTKAIVEIVYEDNNPGNSITITDQNGTSYTLNRLPMNSGGYLYRKIITGSVGQINYTNTTHQAYAQSIVVTVQRDGVAGRRVLSRTLVGGGNPREITQRTFTLPTSDAARNVTVQLPISELTNDGRSIRATASIGGISETILRTYGGTGTDVMPNGCCVDIFEFSLDNVPGNATELTLLIEPVEANGQEGQSYILGGSVAFDIECVCASGTNLTINQNKTEACAGEAVSFSAPNISGLSSGDYIWTFGAGASPASATGQGPHSVTFSGNGAKTITLEAADEACYQAATATVTVGSTANVSSPGSITGNESKCGSYDPAAVASGANASGGSGAVDYQWQSRTGTSGSWTNIPGGLYINPTTISQTMQYRRGARTGSCNPYLYTNVVTKTVTSSVSDPGSISGLQSECGSYDPTTISSDAPATGGTGTLAYQWQSRPAGGNWANISGATAATYNPTTISQTTEYRRGARRAGCAGFSYSNVVVKTSRQADAPAFAQPSTICDGETQTFVVDSPQAGVTYVWNFGPTASSSVVSGVGPHTITFNVPAGQYANSTVAVQLDAYYTGCTGSTTKSFTLDHAPAATLSTSPAGCGSNDGSITLTFADSPARTGIEFSLNGGAYTEVNDNTGSYTFTNLAAGSYAVATRWGNGGCPVSLGNVTVSGGNNVTDAGTISGNQADCGSYDPANITATAASGGNGGTISYQWQRKTGGSWTNITGATGSSYDPGAITTTTQYRRGATRTGCGGTIYSNVVTKTVRFVPQANFAVGAEICSGTTKTFTADNAGAGATYQWNFGTYASPATATGQGPHVVTYTIPASQYSNQAVAVSLVAANSHCEEELQRSFTIEHSPQATLSATAAGCGSNDGSITVTYPDSPNRTGVQFKLNGGGYVNLDDNTGSYTFNNLAAGSYTVLAQWGNVECEVTIGTITVGGVDNVSSAGTISGDEINCGSYDPAAINSMTAGSGGSGAGIVYEWQQRTTGTWTTIAGATGASYDPATITQTTEYRRGAARSGCTSYQYSGTVTKTVLTNVTDAGDIAGDESNCGGYEPTEITAVSAPTGQNANVVYAWHQRTTGNWVNIPGANTPTYNPGYITETTQYRRFARTNGCVGAGVWVVGNVITKTVIDPLTDGGSISGNENNCGAFDPAAIVSDNTPTGGSVEYSWQSRPGTSGTWATIAGATGATYDPGMLTQTTQYRRLARATGCIDWEYTGVVTKTVRINVTDAGSIGNDEVGCDDYNPALIVSTVDASGNQGGSIVYAWQSRPGTSGTWTTISGATSASYDPGTLTQTTQYRRLARTAGCGGPGIWQVTNVVTKTRNVSPIADITVPSADTLCERITHEFEAFYEEFNPADYSWDFGPYANPATATGAGSHIVEFDVPNDAAYTTNMVTVSVTRDGCTSTDTMWVNVRAQPEITLATEAANTSCTNANGTINLTVNNPAATPFQVSIDGGANWGAANQTAFTGLTEGDYDVFIRFNDGACANAYGIVTIDGPAAVLPQADTYTGACPGLAIDGNVLDNDQVGNNVEVSILTPATSGAANVSPDGDFTYVPNAAVCGTDQLTYQVCDLDTDCCASATINIIYEDNTAPTMSAPSSVDTIYCDETVPAAPFVFGFDNCTQVAVTSEEVVSQGQGGCDLNNYTITRTWTATDPCGNVGQTVQTIHVVDAAAPEIFRIHELAGGQKLVAGTTERVSQRWKTVMFPVYYSVPPVVLTQVASQNETSAVVAQVRNVTATQFEVRLREEDANDQIHAEETVAWTAIDAGAAENYEVGTIGVNQYATQLTFANTYAEAPHVLAAAQTTADEDAAVVRQSAKDKLGVALRLQEEISADANTAHSTEQVAYWVLAESGNLHNAAGEVIGETGTVNVSDVAQTVTLANTYHNPVVIANSMTLVGAQQATVRVKHVTANSFTLFSQEFDYLDGGHAVENISYVVVEGSLPLDREVSCEAIPAPLTAGVELVAVDNCGQTELTLEVVSADASCGNDVVYRYAATDMCGNTVSMDQVLTVIDTVAPTFIVPADYSLACSEDRTDLSLTGEPTAIADNCATGLTATYTDDESGFAFCNGDVLRSWKVTDACGNATIHVQVITVVDDRDTDGDGTPDAIDFDTDNDGIADVYEYDIDTDGDGIPNYQDLDSDNDGITDLVEAGYPDNDGNGTVDNYLQAGWDKDGDGFADGYDGDDNSADSLATHTFDPLSEIADRDGDGIPNYRDLDSDNDGITDLVEAQGADVDGDGRVDYDPLTDDVDEDGLADFYDTDIDTLTGAEAVDRALVIYAGIGYLSGAATVNHDIDGDYLPAFWDVDSDNDGIGDLLEAGGVDATGNGKVDIGAGWDDNTDGLHDAYNSFPLVRTDADGATLDGRAEDTDNNGTVYVLGDFDLDGTPNYNDLDADGDGILDLWEVGLGDRDPDNDGRLNAISDLDRNGMDDQLSSIAFLSTEPMLPGTGTRPTDGSDGNDSPYVTTLLDGQLAAANGEPEVDNDGDGELNFLDLDSDNDGILDAVEDANHNGLREATETNAYGADTDGDLILDGIEDANQDGSYTTDETNPLEVDTDGDGVADGVEDANQNGKVSLGESDPRDACDPVPSGNCIGMALRLRVRLQGPMVDAVGGLMRDDLRSLGYLPLTEPYTEHPNFAHQPGMGGETVTDAAVFDVTGSDAIVDWVFIELRDPIDPSIVYYSRSALLQRDGDVVDVDGVTEVLEWPNASGGLFVVNIRHRNHLGAMLGVPVFLSPTPNTVDFTNPSTPLKGINAMYNKDGERMLWAGDFNGDQIIGFQGPNNDLQELTLAVLLDPLNVYYLFNYVKPGYHGPDYNMDGKTIFQGWQNDRNPLLFHTILNVTENEGNVVNFVLYQDVPEDDEYYTGAYSWTDCYELDFPITVKMTNGNAPILQNPNQLAKLIEDDADMVGILLPFDLIDEEGVATRITDSLMVANLPMDCMDDEPVYYYGGYAWDGCFELSYPLTMKLEDGTAIAVNTAAELAVAQAAEMAPVAIALPFEVIFDGNPVQINTETDMEALLEACAEAETTTCWEGGYVWADCYALLYPATFTLPDGSTKVAHNTNQFYKIHNEDNPTGMVFPITLKAGNDTYVANDSTELVALIDDCAATPYHAGEFTWTNCYELVLPVTVKLINGRHEMATNFNKLQKYFNDGALGLVYPFALKAANQQYTVDSDETLATLLEACADDAGYWQGNFDPTDIFALVDCYQFQQPVIFQHTDGYQVSASTQAQFDQVITDADEELSGLYFPIHLYADGQTITVEDMTHLSALLEECLDALAEPVIEVWTGGYTWADCYGLDFPVTFTYLDGSTQVAQDDYGFNQLTASNPTGMLFPISLSHNGNTVTANNAVELEAIVADCTTVPYWGNEFDWSDCYDVLVPVTLKLGNGNIRTAHTVAEAHAYYENEVLGLVYPFQLTDGYQHITINNEANALAQIEACNTVTVYWEGHFHPNDLMAIESCYTFEQPIVFKHKNGNDVSASTANELQAKIGSLNGHGKLKGIYFPVYLTNGEGETVTIESIEAFEQLIEDCENESVAGFYTGDFKVKDIFKLDECYYFTQPVTFLHEDGYTLNAITKDQLKAQAKEKDIIGFQFPIYLYQNGQSIIVQDIDHLEYLIEECKDDLEGPTDGEDN